MKKNIIVLDMSGEEIGRTYEKRARGLIKSGRAESAGENTIRLIGEYGQHITKGSDIDMNTILFKARDWKCVKNAERSMITGFASDMTEVITLGSWDKENAGEATLFTIPEAGENRLVFWLNGGENEDKDEKCKLQIIPTDSELGEISQAEEEAKFSFNLNRNFVRPIKKYKGWNLYSIPFSSDKEYAVLRFVSLGAYTTIADAKDPSEYTGMKNVTDRYAQYRPLRHNIVFEDGWDNDEEYATRYLKDIWGGESVWVEEALSGQETFDAFVKSVGNLAKKAASGAKDIGTRTFETGKAVGGKYGPTVVEAGKKYGSKAVELGKEGVDFVKKGAEKVLESDAVKDISAKIGDIFSKKEESTVPEEETHEFAQEAASAPDNAETAAGAETAEASETSDTADSADSSVDI